MKPDRSRREARAGKARANVLIQSHLSWLAGYPVGMADGALRWQPAPTREQSQPAAVCVDGEKLRRTEFAFRKLVNNFPLALPQLVGDAELWAKRVEFLLEQLKTVAHRHQPLLSPLSRADVPLPTGLLRDARRLQTEFPALAEMTNRLIWASLLDPEAGEQRLAWLRGVAEPASLILRNLPADDSAPALLLLADLARADGNEAPRPFLELLSDPRCFTVTLTELDGYRRDWAIYFDKLTDQFFERTHEPTPQPEPSRNYFGPNLLEFLRWLAEQPMRTRRQAEKLAGLLLSPQLFDAPERRFEELQRYLDGVRRRYRETISGLRKTGRCQVRRSEIPGGHELMSGFDAPTPCSGFFSLLIALKTGAKLPEQAGLLRYLERFPQWHAGLPVRAAVFSELEDEHPNRLRWNGRNYLRDYFRAWDVYARRHAGTLLLWKPMLNMVTHFAEQGWTGWSSDFADDMKQRSHWPIYLEALAAVVPLEDYDDEEWQELLMRLTEATGDAAKTLELFLACRRSSQWSELTRHYQARGSVAAAVRLNRRAEQFPSTLALVNRLEDKLDEAPGSLEQLESCWPAQPELEPLELVLHQRQTAVLQLAGRLQLLKQVGGSLHPPEPGPAAAAEWFARYPREFLPLLTELQRRCPNAERLAENILGDNFPDERKTEVELRAIERKLAAGVENPHLRQRAENLRQRLKSTPAVSPRRLRNLRNQLLGALSGQFVADWLRQTETQLRDYLTGWLGVSSPPDWMLEERSLQVVAGLRKLSPAFQSLGRKTLQTQAGGGSWNYLEEPANQQFLQRMSARGLNLDAWLNPPVTTERIAANGVRLRLSLERTGMEVLRMGGYFNTCLSPWNCNFFSAVANAVDVNKQVLFARNGEGEVVGRCLLALSDNGSLVSFHPYCHVEELKFEEIVRDVVRELAAAVGAVVTTSDRISRLVAPDWYDDGSIDLGLAVDGGESPMSELLRNPPDNGLAERLAEMFEPQGLTSLTLPLVLGLIDPERIADETFRQLLPAIEKHREELPTATHLRIALCAARVGDAGLAHQEIRRYAPEHFRRLREFEYLSSLEVQAIRLWGEHDPSAALRFLRKSRPAWATGDEQDHPHRRELLAEILARLGRPRQAERLKKKE